MTLALGRFGATLGLLLTIAADAPAPVQPRDPQGVYDAARTAWAFTSYPRYANYTISVHYRNGDIAKAVHYDTLEDLRRGIVFGHTFSREETANPSTPHGVNVGMLGMTLNESESTEPIGPLALAVNYDFGISLSPVRTQVAQMGTQIAAPTGLQVIGRSGTALKTYSVRLIEMLDDGKTYHLGLTPLRDPKRFRLREMWVTSGTFITQKVLIAANFARKPYTEVAWLVTFRQIDGGPYIVDERAQGPLDFGDAGTLEDVKISFDDIKETSALPPFGTVGINGGPTEFLTEP